MAWRVDGADEVGLMYLIIGGGCIVLLSNNGDGGGGLISKLTSVAKFKDLPWMLTSNPCIVGRGGCVLIYNLYDLS